jgi:hypothetical protein
MKYPVEAKTAAETISRAKDRNAHLPTLNHCLTSREKNMMGRARGLEAVVIASWRRPALSGSGPTFPAAMPAA